MIDACLITETHAAKFGDPETIVATGSETGRETVAH